MSIAVTRRVWESSRQNGATFTVLLALADYADDDGVAYPGVAALAQKARLSERMTQYAIAQLRESGEVSVEAGGGRHRTHRYTIAIPERVQSTTETPQPLHPLPEPERVQNPVERVQSTTERVQSTARKGAPVAPEPSYKNHQEPSYKNHQGICPDRRIDELFAYYRERIQPDARACPRDKIRARLKTFTLDELKRGIDNFAASPWSMANNAHRGAPWFFHSDQRSETYLHMQPDRVNGTARTSPNGVHPPPPRRLPVKMTVY